MTGSSSGRLPTALWFGFLALLITLGVDGVWAALLVANLRASPTIPWAVGVMAVFLVLLWRYLGGYGWPRGTMDARRHALRARAIPGPVFGWALVAGVSSIIALAGFWVVMHQLVRLPTNPLPDYSRYPLVTVALVLVMASLVGAVVEEASFRGYFQGVLEGTLGGAAAIGIVVLVMAPVHSLTQGFVWSTLLFYGLVDAMLGLLAYLTKSILPGIVVHFLGLLAFFTLIWPRDQSRHLISQGGADIWFWIHMGQTIIFASVAILAFRRLIGQSKVISPALAPVRHP